MADPSSKTSPFVIAASIALVLFSIVGIGAMTGWLPRHEPQAEPPAIAQTTQAPMPQREAAAEQPPPSAAQPSHRTAEKTRTESKPKQSVMAKTCANCGVITSIRTIEQAGEASGLGTLAGGIAGAVLGHQIGQGTGRDVATIAGAVGGGYAGHQIERKIKTTTHYEIVVRMEDGSHRTMMQQTQPAFAIGDKVKIVDGALVRD